jgi:hypothetical protein
VQALAPIVLFVYNRPWHTEQTLNPHKTLEGFAARIAFARNASSFWLALSLRAFAALA